MLRIFTIIIALGIVLASCGYQHRAADRSLPSLAAESPDSFPASARMTSPVSLRLDQVGSVSVEVVAGETAWEDWFSISATKTVSVYLFTPLTSVALSPENQPIFDDATSTWNWNVIGDQPGTHYLDVVVWGHTELAGERYSYLIDHIRSGVTVTATPLQIIQRWLSAHWQWLLTTLVVPFGVWGWHTWRAKKARSAEL